MDSQKLSKCFGRIGSRWCYLELRAAEPLDLRPPAHYHGHGPEAHEHREYHSPCRGHEIERDYRKGGAPFKPLQFALGSSCLTLADRHCRGAELSRFDLAEQPRATRDQRYLLLLKVFERAREEKTRAVYACALSWAKQGPGLRAGQGPGRLCKSQVTSITDRDLQGRQSFSEKDALRSAVGSGPIAAREDRIVLVPPGSDEQVPSCFFFIGLQARVALRRLVRRWKTG